MSWLKLSLFSRGAIGAVSLLAASEYVLPTYSPLDIVSGIHAAITGWNAIAEYLGLNLGYIIGIPVIPADIINALIIGGTIGPAWSFSILKSEWKHHRGLVQNLAFAARAVIAFAEVFLYAMIAISSKPLSLIFLFSIFCLLVPLLNSLARLPAYRNGFLSSIVFLLVLEIVYLVSTEQVQSVFDEFVCERQEAGAPRCMNSDG